MNLALRPALDAEREFCEALHRSNMSAYMATRHIPWEPVRYLASWAEFENLMILADGRIVGLLRLLEDDGALEIRDLQIDLSNRGRGIGTWAVQQAKSLAAERGLGSIRLRVFEENPARALYSRLGFQTRAIVAGKVHMSFDSPPGNT